MGTSITLDNVFEAILIMLLGTVIAVSVVTLVMIGLYRFFKHSDPTKDETLPEATHESSKDPSSD